MDFVYQLTDDERKAVETALRDIEEGRIYSSEAAENTIREWLDKKEQAKYPHE